MAPCCSVCLDPVRKRSAATTTACKHVFHTACLDRWLQHSAGTCPVCRRSIPVPSPEDAWCDQRMAIMRANLTRDQLAHVTEVQTIYNLTFYPLTQKAYHAGEWMPAILRQEDF